MSQPRPDFVSPPRSSPASRRSGAQLRALRKELLLMRADLERAELGAGVAELRGTVARLGWLRLAIPAFVGVVTGLGIRAKSAGGTARRYPLLGALFGTLFSALPGLLAALFTTGGPGAQANTKTDAKARPAARWTSVAFAAWDTWQTWRQTRRDQRQAVEPPSADEPENLRK